MEELKKKLVESYPKYNFDIRFSFVKFNTIAEVETC